MREDTNCDQLMNLTKPGLDHVTDVYETSSDQLPEHVNESDLHDSYKTISDLNSDRTQFKSELSKIVPTEVTKRSVEDNSVWDRMKATHEKYQVKTSVYDSIPIPRPDIGGMSRGKLMVFRDRYRKDGTIKYPRQLQEKLDAGDTSFQEEYLAYLKET